ncbi:MAG TPA: NAD-dependent epimerase/dehydratase family protein, partial [Candidatus Baltobacteraceae bacterium]
MNVLLAGAAGFVGSHLAERFLRDGETVFGVDNLVTGSLANLTSIREHENFRFLEADLSTEGEKITRACETSAFRPNIILHFASPASPVDYAQRPFETLAVNSHGTEYCAAAALRWGAALLFASTSEIYGDPLEHPQRETYWGNVNSIGPRSCYDEGKRYGEAVVMAHVRNSGLDGRLVRIFNTYGPRMRANDGRVVPNFIMQAIRGEALTVYGNGSQTRSFCYVDDLVDGIVRFAQRERSPGMVLNLGNPAEYTISEFARMVAEIAGIELRVVESSLPVDDPTRRCPDISRAKEILGWSPRIDVREGLRRTIAYFRGQSSPVAGVLR